MEGLYLVRYGLSTGAWPKVEVAERLRKRAPESSKFLIIFG